MPDRSAPPSRRESTVLLRIARALADRSRVTAVSPPPALRSAPNWKPRQQHGYTWCPRRCSIGGAGAWPAPPAAQERAPHGGEKMRCSGSTKPQTCSLETPYRRAGCVPRGPSRTALRRSEHFELGRFCGRSHTKTGALSGVFGHVASLRFALRTYHGATVLATEAPATTLLEPLNRDGRARL